MRRLLIILLALCAIALQANAQTRPAQSGDPPILSRIEVSPPDPSGLVTISSASGAVFPNAYVAIRNLFTGETVYTHAGIAGGFTAQIVGTLDTPYWISPSVQDFPRDSRSQGGSMLGGPGAILYPTVAATDSVPESITQIALDGDVSDWAAYPGTRLAVFDSRTVYALRNSESLYLAVDGARSVTQTSRIQIDLTVDGVSYSIAFALSGTEAGILTRTNPNQRALGNIAVGVIRRSAVEARILMTFAKGADVIQLNAIHWLDDAGTDRITDTLGDNLLPHDEIDGIVRIASPIGDDAPRFTAGGAPQTTDGSHAKWIAEGHASNLTVQPGETWRTQLDVRLTGLDLPFDSQIVAELAFQPIAQRSAGDSIARPVSGYLTDNGWSNVLTPSGLPIDGQVDAISLGTATVLTSQIVRREDETLYPIDFTVSIPRNLPPGLYVPVLRGVVESDSGQIRWDQPDSARLTRLPLAISVGGVNNVQLPFVLFADDPSDGSRGILPVDQIGKVELSNRVRYNSPTIILPPYTNSVPRRPIGYAIEPYLPDLMPNLYDSSGTPLVAFELPGGRLTAQVKHPSGRVEDLGTAPFMQNRLSTSEYDERNRFGTTSPVDMFRLTTLEPRFTEYTFDDYGEYVITLAGTINDMWGNTYTGGGDYHIVIAELLDMTPGVLPGTPFTVGDVFNPELRVAPSFPADMTVTIRFYPVDGSDMQEQTLTGKADRSGQFLSNETPLIFQKPGEYVIDYEARYRAVDGSLWAGSLRSAGVVAPADNTPLEAHGARGVPTSTTFRPAWFDFDLYAERNGLDTRNQELNYPYQSGDVAWIPDGRNGGIQPIITLQDRLGNYADWLRESHAITEPDADLTLEQQIDRQEMNVEPDAGYTYISAVRPNSSVRQFVVRGDGGGLPLSWDNDDPLNRQIGAGVGGLLPGDVTFLFGGAVIHPQDSNQEPTTAAYASAALVIDADASPGTRVFPPGRGRDGGGDGGALLTYENTSYDAFIVPTGLQPGDVISVGAPFVFTGQVAPTLPAQVRVTYTKPSGMTVQVEGTANAYGCFFDANARQIADEPGVWSAQVEVTYQGRTSVGVIAAPGLRGGIIGEPNGRFDFYVVPPDSTPLAWNPALTDSIIAIGLPYNFNFTLPQGWSNIRAYLTMTTPGYVLQTSTLRVSGRSFSYQYSASELGRRISNLETDVRTAGNWVSDVRTLTFAAVGTDENGNPAIRTRTFTLMHDRLVTFS